MGCFLAGCCFGKVTDTCLGVRFPWGSQAHRFQICEGMVSLFQGPLPVYPTQLFELVALLLIGILTLRLNLRKALPKGMAAMVALLLYLVFRLCNLCFRADPAGALGPWVYPLGYLLAILACILWMLYLNKKDKEEKT
jgi:phosphatidylglycerol:prolipoprotein diacylglycerol transferase